MNPQVFQVEHLGRFITVKSFAGPVGVARKLFGLTARYTPWVNVDRKTTVVNGDITVKEVDLPLSWVKWC